MQAPVTRAQPWMCSVETSSIGRSKTGSPGRSTISVPLLARTTAAPDRTWTGAAAGENRVSCSASSSEEAEAANRSWRRGAEKALEREPRQHCFSRLLNLNFAQHALAPRGGPAPQACKLRGQFCWLFRHTHRCANAPWMRPCAKAGFLARRLCVYRDTVKPQSYGNRMRRGLQKTRRTRQLLDFYFFPAIVTGRLRFVPG